MYETFGLKPNCCYGNSRGYEFAVSNLFLELVDPDILLEMKENGPITKELDVSAFREKFAFDDERSNIGSSELENIKKFYTYLIYK